jgi:Sec-independent protein translocase protein TatA
MKTEDLLALAALGGGLAAFKKKADKDYAELPEQKEVAARRAKRREELDSFVAKNRKASPEELSEARRKAASEELNLKNTGRRKIPMVDSSGNPITTRSGFAHTEGMKKGGKVSSASSRADGIAQKGKTKGRMI